MRREIASFEVWRTQYLDPGGHPVDGLPPDAADGAELVRLYRAMVLTRTYDAKAVSMQRTGRLGTFASSLGQEAVSVGIGAAMRAEDVLVPSFREQGAHFLRGLSPAELLTYWGGDERGGDFHAAREDFPICVPLGTQAPHAAGVALAFQIRQEPRVVVCVLGDGATSRGDVAEAFNYAGLRRLPVVFVINDNQWAISVPRRAQSAAATLAQKGVAAGIPGEQVDGNDVVAVRAVVGAAVERARRGEGPSLIEALTYRLGDHTTADDASRYRSDAEVSEHWKEDPVARLRAHLVERGLWGRAEEEALLAECGAVIDAAIAEYEAIEPLPPEAIFEHLYATLPEALRAQRDEVIALTRGSDDAHG